MIFVVIDTNFFFFTCIHIVRKYTWSTPVNSIHQNGVVTRGYIIIHPYELDITFHKRY